MEIGSEELGGAARRGFGNYWVGAVDLQSLIWRALGEEEEGKDGSAGGIWHPGKAEAGMEVLEDAETSGSGGALSLEGK